MIAVVSRRLILVAVSIIVMLMPLAARAAGVTVSPAFQNIDLTQEMSGKDVTITLSNRSSVGLYFALSSADFGTLDESGGVAFLGVPSTELEHRYGLVSWMTFDRTSVFIAPAGSKQVLVHIDNRPSLAPGGHYAALLATAVSEPGTAPSDPRVNLHQVIASLILVRKEGGAQPGLNLVGFKLIPNSWFRLPTEAELRFHDAGNLHVVPHGTLVITDPRGKTVSKGIINEDSVTIYPESFRKMTSKLLAVGQAWAPGRYTMTATYRFDNDLSIAKETVSFWYLGNALTALLITAIMLVFGIMFVLYRKLRRRH